MEGIRDLLSGCKLEAVAHRTATMLLKTSDNTAVVDAVQMLRDNNILSVPVIDSETGQFAGVFSVTDLMKAMVKDLGVCKAGSTFDASQAAPVLKKLYAAPVSEVMHAGEIWYIQGQDPSVMDAVKDMLLRGHVHHRLFTCETLKDTSPTGILSQSDVVRLMWDHKVELEPQLAKTVEELGLCAAAAETEDASATLVQVLVDMWRDHKSCMGITHKGELVGNLSISDLRFLTEDLFPLLGQPVGRFLLASRGLPVPEEEDVNWSTTLRVVPVHIVTPTTTFRQVLQALAVNALHRVYVLDDKEHAIGIITLTDVLRQLLPHPPAAVPDEGPAGGLPHSSELPDNDVNEV